MPELTGHICLRKYKPALPLSHREIAQRELLLIVTPEPEEVKKQISATVNMQNVRFMECETNDTWARDHGAITMLDSEGASLLDFMFNGWGLKFASDKDNLITRQAVEAGFLNGRYVNRLGFVLEGGSIESDGLGTLLTTSECLLSPNRNGQMSRDEIEEYLCSVFHLKQVLWLDHGYLAGDDTDSHVDTLARLCSPDTIAMCNAPIRRMNITKSPSNGRATENLPYFEWKPLPPVGIAYGGQD